MEISNHANLPEAEFAELEKELAKHKTLGQVLTWANSQPREYVLPQIVSEVITQDEFTHDVIVPYKSVFLVYDTTWLGAVAAVAVWDFRPSADELLQYRLETGWKPTPSSLKEGDKILGHAACVVDSQGK